MLVTQGELANVLGISSRRVRELAAEKDMFTAKSGTKYELETCVQEYIAYKVDVETSGGNSVDYWQEKAKHEESKRKITQIKLSRMRRDSFDAVDVEEAWSLLVMDFREKLLSFPHKLAPLLIGEDDIFRITQTIEEQVEDALTDLSSFGVGMIQTDEEPLEDDDEDENIPAINNREGTV